MTPEPDSPAPRDTGSTAFSAPDFSETFPHLTKAPIAEAVLEFQAAAAAPLEQQTVKSKLAASLPEYTQMFDQRVVENTFTAIEGKPPVAATRDLGWAGVDSRTQDGKQVAQFRKDGFTFSRLEPYLNWEQFSNEALRLWELHVSLAQPEEIGRIGVRFVNRLVLSIDEGKAKLQDYLQRPPINPVGMEFPIGNFLHQELRVVPGTHYALNLTKAMQPTERASGKLVLILDVDAFTTAPIPTNDPNLANHLSKMRWLKNKAFFASLTPGAIDRYR